MAEEGEGEEEGEEHQLLLRVARLPRPQHS